MTRYFITFLFLIFSSLGMADSPEVDPKYENIEITVNINKASAEELADLLLGVGLKKAQAIVEYRDLNGLFEQPDSLLFVQGIGPAILAKNSGRIRL